jgi:hypothetical protein
MNTKKGRDELTLNSVLGAIALANHENGIWVGPSEILSKSRLKYRCDSRQIAMYILHKYHGFSTTEVAKMLNLANHTTIVHGCKVIRNKARFDKNTNAVYVRTMDLLSVPIDSSLRDIQFGRPEAEKAYVSKKWYVKKLRRLGLLPKSK